MDRVFMILSSADRLVHEELTFMYANGALKHEWMDEVRVIFWGPAQLLIVKDEPLKEYLKKLQDVGVELWACKRCSDDLGVTEKLKDLGIQVEYVGSLVSEMLKDGWYQLTF